MDFCHLIVTCLFSMLRLPFDNQKVKGNYAIFFEKATWIWLNFVCVRQIIYTKYLVVSKTSFTFAPRKGEVLEWLKRHAWKACIPQKGIRGSNPRLSAGKNCKTKKIPVN